MTDRSATARTAPTSHNPATSHLSCGLPLAVALPGSEVNPAPRYLLAAVDTNGVRHYWQDVNRSTRFAPDPTPYSYVAATLTVEGR